MGRDHDGLRRRFVLTVLATAAVLLGGLVSPVPSSAVVGAPVSYLDHTYATTVNRPSEDKPQSKLWYHAGTWWALMVEAGGTRVFIHRLNTTTHHWDNTGTLVDSRLNSTGDALWSQRDSRLYVASRVTGTGTGTQLQINGFSFDGTSWVPAPGYPVAVNSGGGSESATIDQDSRGRLWVTYTRASRVWVAHSDVAGGVAGTNWTPGFIPNVPDTTLKADDLSAVIAFGTSIGVLWSDQQSGAFRFAIHPDSDDTDGVWRVEDALTGLNQADDHINLKQLVGDPQGRIFAAIKTSANDSPTAAPGDVLVGVLTRTPQPDGTGTWALAPAGTVADDHTRPIIMIDSTNQELYFFATAPGNGGDIFYKKSPLTGPISFAPGRGQPFLDVAPVVNNASGAKDPVTAASGLVILAVADGRKQYVHAEMELAGGTSDTTPPTVTATTPADTATGVNVAGNVTATFSETVVGVDKATFTLADAAGTVVPAAVTYNSTTGVASLDPGADLAPGTRYTATLTGGTSAIRDSANNPLVTAQWNFTTAASGDAVAPTVTTTVPAADATAAGLGANVTATFSETVQGVDGTTFTVQNAATGAQVAGVLSRSGLKWIFNPDVDLTADTRYRVTLTGGPAQIRDAANNPLATVTWTFLTGPAPKVSSRTPGVGQTGVRTGVNVTATFNEAVQNVNGSTFRLAGPSGQTVAATVGRNATTNQWVLDPTASLAPSTQYTVTLVGGPGGIADVAGNPLATLTWQFTTGT